MCSEGTELEISGGNNNNNHSYILSHFETNNSQFIVSFYSLFVNGSLVWSVLFFKLQDQLYWE